MALRPISSRWHPPLERVLARVRPLESGCWQWVGKRTQGGYGQCKVEKRQTYVHRLMYETLVADIPSGLTIDHLCLNTLCVNPLHLEPVTNSENGRRRAERQTHCKYGHLYDEANTGHNHGLRAGRYCRACARLRYHLRKAA